jgi:hypothetical protein
MSARDVLSGLHLEPWVEHEKESCESSMRDIREVKAKVQLD